MCFECDYILVKHKTRKETIHKSEKFVKVSEMRSVDCPLVTTERFDEAVNL